MLLSGLVTTSEAVTTVREESTRNSKSTYSLPKSVTKKNSTTVKGPASNTTEKTYPDGRKVRFKTNRVFMHSKNRHLESKLAPFWNP